MVKGKDKPQRIPKTLEQKLTDLDAHLFLLRMHLEGLQESYSHLKAIAAELRTLVCLSSGTEGLLHRLVAEIGVSDSISLHIPGNFDLEHPLVKSMEFGYAPLWRSGHGPAEITPRQYSLRRLIKETDAVLVNGKPLTHEYLIKAVAQQIGTAHEGDEVEPALIQLEGVLVNGVGPITQILSIDAELSLEIGERILEAAEKKAFQCRQMHDHDFGNVSIVTRIKVIETPSAPLRICSFKSYGPGILIECFATSSKVEFHLKKNDIEISKLFVPYPTNEVLRDDFVIVFSYCSRTGQVRTITSLGVAETKECKLGWIHASDFEISVEDNLAGIVQLGFLLTYRRLLSRKEVAELQDLPPDGYGLWKPSAELEAASPFPD